LVARRVAALTLAVLCFIDYIAPTRRTNPSHYACTNARFLPGKRWRARVVCRVGVSTRARTHARTHSRKYGRTQVETFHHIKVAIPLVVYNAVTLRKSVYKCTTKNVEHVNINTNPLAELLYPIPLPRYSDRKTSVFHVFSKSLQGVNFHELYLENGRRHGKVVYQAIVELE
jgi:hypothetical protein